MGTTVINGEPGSAMADCYRELARRLVDRSEDVDGGMRLE